MITVVIPVGPEADACAYLERCFGSVYSQAVKPDAVVIVDDMHGLGSHAGCTEAIEHTGIPRYATYNAWNLGVSASFNIGVSIAPTDHVLLLGADDWLEPNAIELAERTIRDWNVPNGYYWMRVRYNDDRPERDQGQPCGAAVVTKALWRASGGFPVESAVGRSDVMLVGMLLGHPEVGTLIEVRDDGTPPYNYNVHNRSHTATRGPWIRALDETASAYWATFEPPRWGRYS